MPRGSRIRHQHSMIYSLDLETLTEASLLDLGEMLDSVIFREIMSLAAMLEPVKTMHSTITEHFMVSITLLEIMLVMTFSEDSSD